LTRAEKKQVIEYLTSEFQSSAGVIVCDYKGLTVKQLESVRKKARAVQAKVKISKNTLASIALNNSGIENPELKDTNIFLWSSIKFLSQN
jgi:large subunit ribosomal protein L10